MRYRINCIIISLLVAVALLIIVINVHELRELKRSVNNRLHDTYSVTSKPIDRNHAITTTSTRNAWVYPENKQHLRHVAIVLERLGYQLHSNQWQLMWSHDYPFTSHRALIKSLKPHQKVNHFAGSGYFTNKASLAGAKFSFMPRSYRLPQEAALFTREVSHDDDTLWVMKSNEHRGIKVHQFSQLDLHSKGSFLQEFIRHPLLISKRKFDVGLYVAITSVEPLRLYVYNEEVLLRFCSKDYEPFNANDIDSYVVGDDYTPTWKSSITQCEWSSNTKGICTMAFLGTQITSLQQSYADQMLSHKQSLSIYLKSQGYDPNQIWDDMNRIIVMVMLKFESSVYTATKEFADPSHFFELVRFDFVIDSKLKVWLMEVNMSPNLSSAHFTANAVMYEQVLFNLFNLIGIAQPTGLDHYYCRDNEQQMLVSDRDVKVSAQQCITSSCNHCSSLHCKLCHQCQSEEIISMLKTTYLEHLNRHNYKRLFPIPKDYLTKWSTNMPDYSDSNKLLALWFEEKCKQDSFWCT